MNLNSAIKVLRQHQLKATSVRIGLLQLLAKKSTGISFAMIKQEFDIKLNSVTLYRVLKNFEAIRLIHKVLDSGGTANYMLSLDDASKSKHQQHMHFNCTQCNNIFCLNELSVPHFYLPEDFQTEFVGVTLIGICPGCNIMV